MDDVGCVHDTITVRVGGIHGSGYGARRREGDHAGAGVNREVVCTGVAVLARDAVGQ